MVPYVIEFRIDGFNEYGQVLPNLKREVMIALLPLSKRIEVEIKASIGRNRPPINSAVWLSAPEKQGKPTLYNTGFLKESVKSRVVPGRGDLIAKAEAGHFDKVQHPDGRTTVDRIANLMNVGATYVPTPAQRRAFWAKVGGLQNYTGPIELREQWQIPVRDYLTPIMRNTRIKHQFKLALERASKAVYGKKGR